MVRTYVAKVVAIRRRSVGCIFCCVRKSGPVAEWIKRDDLERNVTVMLFFRFLSRKILIISNKMRVFGIFCVYLRAFL